MTYKHRDRVLAIAPTFHGFAFVVFEGPLSPFDWGTLRIKGSGKNAITLKRIQAIIRNCNPQTIVIENLKHPTKGRARVHALNLAIRHLAKTTYLDAYSYDRAAIRRCFAPAGARTKVEIAHTIARFVPAFRHRLPPVRKIWMTEDPRQSLFDAAALGLAHYESLEAMAKRK